MAHAAETGVPGEVAFEEARRYAREIVPGFSATVYFGFGTRAAKWLSRLLFRVRVGRGGSGTGSYGPQRRCDLRDEPPVERGLCAGDVAGRGSFGCQLRGGGMGAGLAALSADPVDGGLLHPARQPQCALPQGAGALCADGDRRGHDPGDLSRRRAVAGWAGRAGQAGASAISSKAGRPTERDVVFVPVGLAYDRVLEDRVLVEAAHSGTRRFRNRPLLGGDARGCTFLWRRMRGLTKGFGTAAAAFGAPRVAADASC